MYLNQLMQLYLKALIKFFYIHVLWPFLITSLFINFYITQEQLLYMHMYISRIWVDKHNFLHNSGWSIFLFLNYIKISKDFFSMQCNYYKMITYQPQHTTTSCWFWVHGRGALAFSSGKNLYHSVWPSTCWHRYGQLLELLRTVVLIHQKPSAHIMGIHLQQLSFFPNQRYGF